MSSIFISGGSGLTVFGYNQVFSSNALTSENKNLNQGQSQGRIANNKGTSTAAIQEIVSSQQDTALLCTFTSGVCDFNIQPDRFANIESTGTIQSAGNNQVSAQPPLSLTQQNLNVNVGSSIPSVSTTATTFPNPGVPFRTSITGNDAINFAGAETQGNNNGSVTTSSSVSVSGDITRDHSIGMDGRVLYTDQFGAPADPTNPAATPGYDPVTNTAPGSATFVLFSGDVTSTDLFIPGPIPGDPDPTVTGSTASNLSGGISISSGGITGLRGSGQFGNGITISNQGNFTHGTTSFLTIGFA